MLLDELELVLRGGGLEQTLEFTQVPDTVSGSQLAGGLHVGRGMFSGQLQKTLQNPNALRAAVFHHGYGPVARVPTDEPGTIQQPARPIFNGGAFAAVDVDWIRAEAPWLLSGGQGDLFPARV